MQKFIAEESFWNLFPDAQIGLIVVRHMKNAAEVSSEDQAEIADMLREANDAAGKYLTSDTISENEVVQVWREAFRQFKTKKGARSSIENLLKRVLKGKPVSSITPSVDLYNIISLRYALPVGGENIEAFEGDVRLGITTGNDDFWPIGEDKKDPTLPGEICYRDDVGAICRCWNWRDGVRTALSDDAHDALLVIENVDAQRSADLATALDELAVLLERYLDADIESKVIVTRDNPEMVLVP